VPAGIVCALLGLLLLYVYVPVAQLAAPDLKVEVGNTVRGVAVFGLLGFGIAAAFECVRWRK
jgi:hypothetical protein